MDSVSDLSSDQGLANEVMDSVGEEPSESVEQNSDVSHMDGDGNKDDLPKGVKERLGRQEKRHQREMRQMREQLEAMRAQAANREEPMNSANDPYTPQNGVDEQIHKAVSYALRQKEMEERKAQEVASRMRVAKQYEELNKHLDDVSDRYDDFEDVVRNNDAPFTPSMRDAALILPKSGPGSAGEVLYKLGKNPDELNRIARLHPVDQAQELVTLSHALIKGADNKGNAMRQPLGNIKSNPVVNTRAVTDKTPVSELRKRMREGWK